MGPWAVVAPTQAVEIMMCRAWAEEEFGRAELGNKQRTRRIVGMAEMLLERPGGTVTRVFPKGPQRQGAYKALENGLIRAEELELTRNVACAERMQELGGLVVVPVDKMSIQLSDREGVRNFGSVGNRTCGTRGVQAITGLALDAEGAPLGVAHQMMWPRSEEPSPKRRPGKNRKRERDRRPPSERESAYWVEVMRRIHELTVEHAPNAREWFQLDREADFWGVHMLVAELGVLATVRLNREHVVRDTKGEKSSLKAWLRSRPIERWLELTIPAHDGRPQRTAQLSLRLGQLRMRLPVPGGPRWVDMSIVYIDESLRPNAKDRIQWILGTTYPVHNVDDALVVLENYKRRWRIEDFHRAWKSGACDIETSQLQSFSVFRRWAILTSSMAARAEHIKHYSREYPEAPATKVYTQDEIDTVIAWRLKTSPKAENPYRPGDVPPLGLFTRWVAELGGYMKSSKAPPPGTVTIMRGLEYLEALVRGRQIEKLLAIEKSD
jgi:hypothetical protein